MFHAALRVNDGPVALPVGDGCRQGRWSGRIAARPVSILAVDFLSLEYLYIEIMGKPDLLPGTLDMLILKTLTRAPLHGYGIAQSIKRMSDDVLTVEEGSLYPALQRLLLQGWVKAEWRMTETNRRARFYTLTAAGRKQLGVEVSQFEQMIAAIGRVLAEQA